MTTRTPDWKPKLHKYLDSALNTPFVWGKHDCALFAAKAVDAMRGNTALYDEVTSTWPCTSAASAAAVMHGKTLQQMAEAVLWPMGAEGWAHCGCGDVVLAVCDGQQILTVHDGFQILGPGTNGIVRVRIETAIGGWRVP
jgi:hypothetical protein